MRAFAVLLTAGTLLAGCAAAPPVSGGAPGRSDLRDFSLEARFALRTERPNEAAQTASGRLSWSHRLAGDSVLIANPLGQGIARIETSAAGAQLQGSDGSLHRSRDAAALLREATGYTLPLDQLPAWLLGRPGPDGRLDLDALGRPRRLLSEGWRIDYGYDDDGADALPARLTVSRDNDLELRLRIEEWRAAP